MDRSKRSKGLILRAILILCILTPILPIVVKADSPWPEVCVEWELSTGDANYPFQKILTCVPQNFNGDLIVYAHGYVPPQEPLALPTEELLQFPGLLEAFVSAGYGFATSSYRKNGYAVQQAGEDLNALVQYFKNLSGKPAPVDRVFAVGASEGGLITTMLVEKHPEIYAGGLAMCGPVGGMPDQIEYIGDFRVVFDYFYPELLDFHVGTEKYSDIDEFYDQYESACALWEDYAEDISQAIDSDSETTDQLFSVTDVARETIADDIEAALTLLNYNVCGTVDLMRDTAGEDIGMPYGNVFRWYFGSDDDKALNSGGERVRSNWRGRRYIRRFYRPTGKLQRPLVTLHTIDDPVVPFDHELRYWFRVALQGRSHFLISWPVFEYGHCNFRPWQVLGAFLLLLSQAEN